MLTPQEQAAINQGSIDAANKANASKGLVPAAPAGSSFITPPDPGASKTLSPSILVTSSASRTNYANNVNTMNQASANMTGVNNAGSGTSGQVTTPSGAIVDSASSYATLTALLRQQATRPRLLPQRRMTAHTQTCLPKLRSNIKTLSRLSTRVSQVRKLRWLPQLQRSMMIPKQRRLSMLSTQSTISSASSWRRRIAFSLAATT